MWKILKAELRYNWINFVVFLGMVPLVHVVETRYESGYLSFMVFILMLLMVNGWNIRYIREKRDYQLAQLPVAARRVAAARILMVLLPAAALIGWYALVHIAFMPRAHVNIKAPLMFWGLFVTAYSLAFMFRDRFIGTRALMRGKALLVAVLGATVVLNLWTMISFNRARAQGESQPALIKFFEFIERHNPTTSSLNMTVWLAVSLALAYLTTETYARRRGHI